MDLIYPCWHVSELGKNGARKPPRSARVFETKPDTKIGTGNFSPCRRIRIPLRNPP